MIDFDKDFWPLYPKGTRNGHGSLQGSKKEARKVWLKLTKDERTMAMKAVRLVVKHQFIPHASKWLRQELYETVLENQVADQRAKPVCKICGSEDVTCYVGGKGHICRREDCVDKFARL